MIEWLDKAALLATLKEQLEAELAVMQNAQKQSLEGATHEEARSEGDKDMRATEVSYLARGQALRVVELTEGLTRLSLLRARSFGPEDPLAMGAVVLLEDQASEEHSCFLLAPAGAGTRLSVSVPQGREKATRGGAKKGGGLNKAVTSGVLEVVVLTPSAPLGRALLGQRVGDEVELVVPAKKRTYVVLEVS